MSFLSGLAGLGGKIGGALGGLGGQMGGGGLLDNLRGSIDTTPGAVAGALNGQQVTAPPTFQRMGGVTGQGGLLDTLRRPTDEKSLGWGDKLYAIGSIMQGDSGGAANYLAGQKEAAQKTADREKVEARRKAGLEAFGAAMGGGGQFNARDYIQRVLAAGGDLGDALETAQALAPKVSLQNAGGGGLYEITQGPFGGSAAARALVEPKPEKTLEDKVAEAEALAAARRRGAPPVGRSGGGRGRAGGGKKAAGGIPSPGAGFVIQQGP